MGKRASEIIKEFICIQQATIDNLLAQTSNEKIKRGLILGQIRVADAEEELKRNTADWTKEKLNNDPKRGSIYQNRKVSKAF